MTSSGYQYPALSCRRASVSYVNLDEHEEFRNTLATAGAIAVDQKTPVPIWLARHLQPPIIKPELSYIYRRIAYSAAVTNERLMQIEEGEEQERLVTELISPARLVLRTYVWRTEWLKRRWHAACPVDVDARGDSIAISPSVRCILVHSDSTAAPSKTMPPPAAEARDLQLSQPVASSDADALVTRLPLGDLRISVNVNEAPSAIQMYGQTTDHSARCSLNVTTSGAISRVEKSTPSIDSNVVNASCQNGINRSSAESVVQIDTVGAVAPFSRAEALLQQAALLPTPERRIRREKMRSIRPVSQLRM